MGPKTDIYGPITTLDVEGETLRHEMARLQKERKSQRRWIPDQVGDDRRGERVVVFDPLLDTFQFSRHEFVECA